MFRFLTKSKKVASEKRKKKAVKNNKKGKVQQRSTSSSSINTKEKKSSKNNTNTKSENNDDDDNDNDEMDVYSKLIAEDNPNSYHRKRTKWEPMPEVSLEDICYVQKAELHNIDKIREEWLCIQGTCPRPVIWLIGRYENLTAKERLVSMELVSKGVGTAVQYGDGVLFDSGLNFCAGDVKFPNEIRHQFPLIGVSHHRGEYRHSPNLHWGSDQHVIVHCEKDYFPIANQLIIDSVVQSRACKCIVVLVGGIEKKDLPLLEVAGEFEYPIIAIESSGGLALEVCNAVRKVKNKENYFKPSIDDFVKFADIKIFPNDLDYSELTALLHFFMITNIFDYSFKNKMIKNNYRKKRSRSESPKKRRAVNNLIKSTSTLEIHKKKEEEEEEEKKKKKKAKKKRKKKKRKKKKKKKKKKESSSESEEEEEETSTADENDDEEESINSSNDNSNSSISSNESNNNDIGGDNSDDEHNNDYDKTTTKGRRRKKEKTGGGGGGGGSGLDDKIAQELFKSNIGNKINEFSDEINDANNKKKSNVPSLVVIGGSSGGGGGGDDDDDRKYTYKDGSIYNGDMKAGMPNGKGIINYSEKNIKKRKKYEGEVNDGKCDGNGKLLLRNGDTYEGTFNNDKRNGTGKSICNFDEFQKMLELQNWEPENVENVVYEGEWKDDKANGKGELTINKSSMFKGNFKNNLMDGQGKIEFVDPDDDDEYWYEGIFKNGKLSNGKGKINNSEFSYEGEFKNGKPNGHGKLINKEDGEDLVHAQGCIYLGNVYSYEGEGYAIQPNRHGQGEITFTFGSYKGGFKDDNFHGKGELILKDMYSYKGDFKDGEKEGHGEIVYGPAAMSEWGHPDGTTYVGDWENDQFHGNGEMTIVDPETEEKGSINGEFKDGSPNGFCRMEDNNGVYEGQVVHNWDINGRHGKGKMIYANGNIYEGEWKEDERHGEGKMIFGSDDSVEIFGDSFFGGSVYIGEWEEGKICGKGKLTYDKYGIEYIGDWLDNKKHGKGKLSDGPNVYEGDFLNDEYHGHGKEFKRFGDAGDTSEYEGEFQDGKKHGSGELRVEQNKGKPNFGGEIYIGQFKDDMKNGKGKLLSITLENGEEEKSEYNGEFKDNVMHGYGTMDIDGERVYEGRMENGEPVDAE